jgi:hypothetical protein
MRASTIIEHGLASESLLQLCRKFQKRLMLYWGKIRPKQLPSSSSERIASYLKSYFAMGGSAHFQLYPTRNMFAKPETRHRNFPVSQLISGDIYKSVRAPLSLFTNAKISPSWKWILRHWGRITSYYCTSTTLLSFTLYSESLQVLILLLFFTSDLTRPNSVSVCYYYNLDRF